MALAEMMGVPETPHMLYQSAATTVKKAVEEIKPPVEKKVAAETSTPPATKPEKQAEKQVPVQKSEEKPTSKPAAGSKSTVTLDQVVKAWREIRAIIKPQSRSLDGLLNSCKLLEVKNDVLIVGFQSEILRSKADTPEQLAITCKAIQQVVGAELGVRCVVSNFKGATPPDIKADGMVAAALKHGGEIVE